LVAGDAGKAMLRTIIDMEAIIIALLNIFVSPSSRRSPSRLILEIKISTAAAAVAFGPVMLFVCY
jgi:hypothetical protein